MKTNKLATELKVSMVKTYRKFGEKKGLITKGKSWTGNEVADEIEQETEFGIHMVDMLLQLTIDLLKRDKINQDGNSK